MYVKIAIFSRLISEEFERAGGILASSRFELTERGVVSGIVYRRIGQRRRWAFGWCKNHRHWRAGSKDMAQWVD